MLDDGGPWRAQLQILEGQYLELPCDRVGELAGAQQEIGVARLAEAFVASGEGLVKQQPARPDGSDDEGQDRAVQVVRDQDEVEALSGQRPGAAVLEIGTDLGQARRVGLLIGIAVQGRHRQAVGQQQPAMPPAPRRDIERPAAGRDQREEAANPGRGCLRSVQVWAIYEGSLITA